MSNILLFDAETQHYRQSIYKYFHNELKKTGYNLHVLYDQKLNRIDNSLFTGIKYNLRNFIRSVNDNDCNIIILFVWLRYTFLFPFMIYCKIKGIKIITWSHGINLQKKYPKIVDQLFYLRQYFSDALIIFSKNETKHIKASHEKLFVANNTLNFNDFPKIKGSKEDLKKKYKFENKKIVLCVGRMNTNNRKLDHLIDVFGKITYNEIILLIIGPGVTQSQIERINKLDNSYYWGPIYNPIKINEAYKMSDVFCMPGAIGLAVNHAFFYGLPVIVEDVPHGPEAIYIKNGMNGYFYKTGDINDLKNKIATLLYNIDLYESFSLNAKVVITEEASIEKMFEGFKNAIEFVTLKKGGLK